jgi:hypothetical protein
MRIPGPPARHSSRVPQYFSFDTHHHQPRTNINQKMSQALENELEASLAKMRQTLRYWQTWEAEYEGFKEELEIEDPEPSAQRMVEIASEFGSSIIDDSGT